MKINWEEVAKSEGYKSLKESCAEDIRSASRMMDKGRSNRIGFKNEKDRIYRKFRWVINRAKHYSHKINMPLKDVLNAWEKDRRYWYMNYYQDSNQPRLSKESVRKSHEEKILSLLEGRASN